MKQAPPFFCSCASKWPWPNFKVTAPDEKLKLIREVTAVLSLPLTWLPFLVCVCVGVRVCACRCVYMCMWVYVASECMLMGIFPPFFVPSLWSVFFFSVCFSLPLFYFVSHICYFIQLHPILVNLHSVCCVLSCYDNYHIIVILYCIGCIMFHYVVLCCVLLYCDVLCCIKAVRCDVDVGCGFFLACEDFGRMLGNLFLACTFFISFFFSF